MKLKRVATTQTTINAACRDCAHYDAPSGQCRINPPTAGADKWPVVEATDWCAKFAPAD